MLINERKGDCMQLAIDAKSSNKVDRFRHIISCETVSNADPHKVNWAEFNRLHELLRIFYPTIFALFEETQVGEAGIQLRYRVKKPRRKPFLIMSHQDVVEPGDLAQWHENPFSASFHDGAVWGRGTTDCKHLLFAQLEAVEALLREGWRPDFDLYLSLGYSEEIYRADGQDGGRLLAENLRDTGVHIGCLIDEGGRIIKSDDGQVTAYVGLGEKAAVNFELVCNRAGGHSSKPGAGTALGQVARAAVALEEHPFPYRLTALVKSQLQALAQTLSGERARIYADPEKYWDELTALAKTDNELDAMLHTTFAVTMASGSTQPNVMPSRASIGVSCRILQGDTVASVMAYIRSIIPSSVEIIHISGLDPQPTATVASDEFRLLSAVVRNIYGQHTTIVPFLMLGATDSRYYAAAGVADHVFRFGGFLVDDRFGTPHAVNEHIPVDAIDSAQEFVTQILKAY